MSAQARRAYEAYLAAMAEVVAVMPPSRRPSPWEELPATNQEAWRAAVAAAVDDPRTETETLTEKQVRLLHEAGTVEIGRKVKAMLPPDIGFILMTVGYGKGGDLAYIATVSREDSVRVVREWLKKQGAL